MNEFIPEPAKLEKPETMTARDFLSASLQRLPENEREWWERTHFRRDYMLGVWWFNENLHGPGEWLPGLANLKHFTARLDWDIIRKYYKLSDARLETKKPIIGDNLPRIFFLPRIQSIRIDGWHIRVADVVRIQQLESFKDLSSPVRRLVVDSPFWTTSTFTAIAGITGALQDVDIGVSEDRVNLQEVYLAFFTKNKGITRSDFV
ncbi:hypothetical protein ABW20_dc0106320 [Dactylellina cionopaga]|nr:hypothetical protein ABW20_dc0106320 [Dactylellina cionopaga]